MTDADLDPLLTLLQDDASRLFIRFVERLRGAGDPGFEQLLVFLKEAPRRRTVVNSGSSESALGSVSASGESMDTTGIRTVGSTGPRAAAGRGSDSQQSSLGMRSTGPPPAGRTRGDGTGVPPEAAKKARTDEYLLSRGLNTIVVFLSRLRQASGGGNPRVVMDLKKMFRMVEDVNQTSDSAGVSSSTEEKQARDQARKAITAAVEISKIYYEGVYSGWFSQAPEARPTFEEFHEGARELADYLGKNLRFPAGHDLRRRIIAVEVGPYDSQHHECYERGEVLGRIRPLTFRIESGKPDDQEHIAQVLEFRNGIFREGGR